MVANTKQPEIDYQLTNGTNAETHYKGDGGVQLSNFFDQAMFAIRFSDFNLLISNQITSQSRLMFDRGVQARVAKAAPFLSLDSDPYPVLVNGQIDWVQDAYTTTDNYPYAQNADTSALPVSSGLNQNFNYVRNSVKVLINAYTGKMTFYVMDPNDPIIETYEKAFPGHVHAGVEDEPRAEAATSAIPRTSSPCRPPCTASTTSQSATSFYSAADAWTLSPSPGSGSPSQALQTTLTTNAQGQMVSTGQLVRMAPIYQELRVPGQANESFTLLDAFVPVSRGSQIQTLSGFMIAGSDPGHYGKLQMFVTPRNSPVDGPVDRGGPDRRHFDGVEPDLPAQPERFLRAPGQCADDSGGQLAAVHPAALRRVVAECHPGAAAGDRRLREPPGRHRATRCPVRCPRCSAHPCPRRPTRPAPPGRSHRSCGHCWARRSPTYQQSQTDLKAGNLGAYQTDINNLENDLNQVETQTGGTVTSTTTTTTTTQPGN